MDRFLNVGDIFELSDKGIILANIPAKYVFENTPNGEKRVFHEVELGKTYNSYIDSSVFFTSEYEGEYICTTVSESELYPEGTLEEGQQNVKILYFTAKRLLDKNEIGFYQQNDLPESFKAILLPEYINLV